MPELKRLRPGDAPAVLRAATSHENVASQRVLAKAGFVPVGPADPADLGGKQGTWHQRDVAILCAAPDIHESPFTNMVERS